MRVQISVGQTNDYGVVVVGGPYRAWNRGNSTKWDFLCPYCNQTFLSPTTRFKSSKSCYGCRGEVTKSYNDNTTWDYLYHVVKGRKSAKEKGFGLTKECFRLTSQMNCYYCGAEPTLSNGYRPWHPKIKINGLDRVDPSMGYFDNNVVACCKDCNTAKLDKTEEEFISWLIRVATHQRIITSHSTSIQNTV
jgi:hypothetical protein